MQAVAYFDISVRINVDGANPERAPELLEILKEAGLAGKLTGYLGQLVAIDDGTGSPSASYTGCCFRNDEFARAELEFNEIAAKYGFYRHALPKPTGASERTNLSSEAAASCTSAGIR